MDFLDFLWNVSQERQIDELRKHLDRVRLEQDLGGGDLRRKVQELAEDNVELKLRLGLLVRLLIGKGLFTAEEFAGLIAATRPRSHGEGSRGGEGG
jgi:hypothetical protein